MGRKNGNVGKKTRLNRREKGEARPFERSNIPRLRLDELVIPDGKCFFRSRKGKDIFLGEEKAATALRHAQQQHIRKGSGHVEKRYYPCPEGGCGGYHLTSRDEFDDSWRKARS